MDFKKFRWSQVYESSEEELIALLQSRDLGGERIHAEASAQHNEQHNDQTITLWCAEGSFVVVAGATNISMQPGDALRLPAHTVYSIQPGISDCAYYLTS